MGSMPIRHVAEGTAVVVIDAHQAIVNLAGLIPVFPIAIIGLVMFPTVKTIIFLASTWIVLDFLGTSPLHNMPAFVTDDCFRLSEPVHGEILRRELNFTGCITGAGFPRQASTTKAVMLLCARFEHLWIRRYSSAVTRMARLMFLTTVL